MGSVAVQAVTKVPSLLAAAGIDAGGVLGGADLFSDPFTPTNPDTWEKHYMGDFREAGKGPDPKPRDRGDPLETIPDQEVSPLTEEELKQIDQIVETQRSRYRFGLPVAAGAALGSSMGISMLTEDPIPGEPFVIPARDRDPVLGAIESDEEERAIATMVPVTPALTSHLTHNSVTRASLLDGQRRPNLYNLDIVEFREVREMINQVIVLARDLPASEARSLLLAVRAMRVPLFKLLLI